MPVTRRTFIKRTGEAAVASLFLPSLWRYPWLRPALAETTGDRYFVIVYLDGGNDGLNTVTPLADGGSGALRAAYEAARPAAQTGSLQLSISDLAPFAIANDRNSGTPL